MWCKYHNSKKSKEYEKGSALFLALMLTVILLGIGVGVSGIIVSQLQQLRGLGDSVFAFGAADAGAERGLFVDRVYCNAIEPLPANAAEFLSCAQNNLPGVQTLSNGSSYILQVEGYDPTPPVECLGDYYCIEAKGRFQRNPAAPSSIRSVQIDR